MAPDAQVGGVCALSDVNADADVQVGAVFALSDVDADADVQVGAAFLVVDLVEAAINVQVAGEALIVDALADADAQVATTIILADVSADVDAQAASTIVLADVNADADVDSASIVLLIDAITAEPSTWRVFPELHSQSWVLSGDYDGGISLILWCDTQNPPQSGILLEVSATEAVLSDMVGGEIFRQPVSIASAGTWRCLADGSTIMLWVNGKFTASWYVPAERSFRVGAVACEANVTRLVADEMFEPAIGLVWIMRETARDVLQRLLEGRDATLRERSDGSIQATLLEQREDLGSLTGAYFVTYARQAADQEWASALVAWGAESWVMVTEPTADRLRWAQWQTPHINDEQLLRTQAMRRLRKLWALKDLRTFRGPFDPRIEVGDELTVDSIRGIPAGRYLVRRIGVVGERALTDMQVAVQALPDDLVLASWPILPGVDRPAGG